MIGFAICRYAKGCLRNCSNWSSAWLLTQAAGTKADTQHPSTSKYDLWHWDPDTVGLKTSLKAKLASELVEVCCFRWAYTTISKTIVIQTHIEKETYVKTCGSNIYYKRPLKAVFLNTLFLTLCSTIVSCFAYSTLFSHVFTCKWKGTQRMRNKNNPVKTFYSGVISDFMIFRFGVTCSYVFPSHFTLYTFLQSTFESHVLTHFYLYFYF